MRVMSAISIIPASTALAPIDLQRGMVAGKTVPHAPYLTH